jgi:hypothetical protein
VEPQISRNLVHLLSLSARAMETREEISMTNRFLMSVAAAALIAGTGFAYAQGTGTSREAPGSSAQQSAPSSSPSSATPMNRDSDKGAPGAKTTQSEEKAKGAPGAKTTQSEEKAQPGGAKNQRAQDEMKGSPKAEKSVQDGNMKGERSKTTETDTTKGAKDTKGNMNAQGREDRMNAEQKGGREDRMNAQGREDRLNAEQKGSAGTTTGQVGGSAKLSTEQRTRISSVIREQHVQPVTHVDFDIRPGVRVPRSGVSFHPLPPDIVTIYPEWRGYEYFLVNNQIVVVNPRTLEIVDVIDV